MNTFQNRNKKALSLLIATTSIYFLLSCDTLNTQTENKHEDPYRNYHSSVPNICLTNDGKLLITEVREFKDGLSELWLLQDGHESVIAQGTDWIVNWADFPTILGYGDEGENLVASYLVETDPDLFAYDVRLVMSSDGGKSWSDPLCPHNDATVTEHGFVSMVAVRDDAFMVVWLDGRNYAELEGGNNMQDQMQLRAALISSSGVIEDEFLIDPNVCSCCGTDIVATPGGISVVYRDRHAGELRDISLSRYEFTTGQWTEPQTVHNDGWVIAGCPVNGPAIDAHGDRVIISWYTESNRTPTVLASHSIDGGLTFSTPLKINSEYTQGRVDAVLLDDHSAALSWMEGEIGEVNLKTCIYKFSNGHGDGHGQAYQAAVISSTETVTPVNGSRASGFPKMKKQSPEHGDPETEELVFVFTHLSIDEATQGLTPEARVLRLELN